MSKQPYNEDLPQDVPPGWWPVFNTTDLVIPSNAAAVFDQVRSPWINGGTGANHSYLENIGGDDVVRLKQADEAHVALPAGEQMASLWINSDSPIPPKRWGIATRLWPAKVLVKAGAYGRAFTDPNATTSLGDLDKQLGLTAGQWYLSSGINSGTGSSASPSVGPAVARLVAKFTPAITPAISASDSPLITALVDQEIRFDPQVSRLWLSTGDTLHVDAGATFQTYNSSSSTIILTEYGRQTNPAWTWTDRKALVATRNVNAWLSISATLQTDESSNVRLLINFDGADNSTGTLTVDGAMIPRGGRMAIPNPTYPYTPTEENVSFGGPVRLLKGYRYEVYNSSGVDITAARFNLSIMELPNNTLSLFT